MDLDALERGARRLERPRRADGASRWRRCGLRYEAFFGQTRGALDGDWCVGGHQRRLPAARQPHAARGGGRPGPVPVRGLRALLHEPQAPRPVRAADRRRVLRASRPARGWRRGSSRPAASTPGSCSPPRSSRGWASESEAERILGSVETVICHRVNTPEQIISLAGTRRAMEYSTHYAEEGVTGEGSARIQHQYKVDPEQGPRPPTRHRVRDQPRPRDDASRSTGHPSSTSPLPQPAELEGGERAVPHDIRVSEKKQAALLKGADPDARTPDPLLPLDPGPRALPATVVSEVPVIFTRMLLILDPRRDRCS